MLTTNFYNVPRIRPANPNPMLVKSCSLRRVAAGRQHLPRLLFRPWFTTGLPTLMAVMYACTRFIGEMGMEYNAHLPKMYRPENSGKNNKKRHIVIAADTLGCRSTMVNIILSAGFSAPFQPAAHYTRAHACEWTGRAAREAGGSILSSLVCRGVTRVDACLSRSASLATLAFWKG
jgi:hypothetical protein